MSNKSDEILHSSKKLQNKYASKVRKEKEKELQTLSIRLSAEEKNSIRKLANDNHLSMSEIVKSKVKNKVLIDSDLNKSLWNIDDRLRQLMSKTEKMPVKQQREVLKGIAEDMDKIKEILIKVR